MVKDFAIIGSGISGMGSAYFAYKQNKSFTLFEKDQRFGGHTNTVQLANGVSMDTGFMVFNHPTYPYLTKLFEELKVDICNTSMSFSVRYDPRKIEFNGSSLGGLFAQRKNLFNPRFIKMLLKIDRFNKIAPQHLESGSLSGLTIKEYLEREQLGTDIFEQFLAPMSSAVWSTPAEQMGDFSAETLVRFFYNHGFLGLDTQHQWKTVVGGSQQYREKILRLFPECLKKGEEVSAIKKDEDCWEIFNSHHESLGLFKNIIFAGHADQTRKILEQSSGDYSSLLKYLAPFHYQKNEAIIHTDSRVMPRLKRNWSSWNYVAPEDGDLYTVYYMNSLQKVSQEQDYFININGRSHIRPEAILKQIDYDHPLFNQETLKAQKDLHLLNQDGDHLFFCGSYFRYGFHEDGLWSAVKLAEELYPNQRVLQ
jgi:uncharacterized protein